MKKIIAIFMTFAVMLTMVGCVQTEIIQKPTEGVTEEETKEIIQTADVLPPEIDLWKEWEFKKGEEFEILVRGNCDTMSLSEQTKEIYPKLEERVVAVSDEKKAMLKSDVDEMYTYAKEMEKEGSVAFPWTIEYGFVPVRADGSIVSIIERSASYTGGAHSNYGYRALNIDPVTGEMLSAEDVFNETEGLKDIVKKELLERYGEDALFDVESAFETVTLENLVWTLDFEGVTFHFDPYVLSSFSAGVIEAKLSFEKYPHLVKEKYTIVPDSYIMFLGNGVDTLIDVDSDGKYDEISYYTEGESIRNSIDIYINDERETFEIWGYDTEVYLAHMEKDGKENNYLYAYSTSEGRGTEIRTYKISADGISLVEVTEEYLAGAYGVDNIVTEMFLDIMGTKLLESECYVDFETGRLTKKSNVYKINKSNTQHITKKPIKVMVLPFFTEEEITSGVEFILESTDGKTYIEATMEDGRACRIPIEEREEWGDFTIHSEHTGNYFTGVVYAS